MTDFYKMIELKLGILFALMFVVAPSFYAQGDISTVEYYFNTDPGVGNGTVIDVNPDVEVLSQNFTIPTTSLSAGTHRLFVRAVKDDGSVSYQYYQSFTIKPGNATFNNADIDGAEYYFDTDPGLGNGIPISIGPNQLIDENTAIVTSALSEGNYRAFIRVKNSNGFWSYYDRVTFSVVPLADFNLADINAVEYFFDQDPGVGNGNPIAVTATDVLNQNLLIPSTGLSQGTHRLFIRTQNEDGTYSLYGDVTFTVVEAAFLNTFDIISAEYFIDSDPGVGNGTPVNFTPGDPISESFLANTTGLSQGDHYLYVRVQNADGKWSLLDGKFFEVSGTLSTTDVELAEISLYPNPVSDQLQISYKGTIKSKVLYDMTGKKVMQDSSGLEMLDVSALQTGTYILQIITDIGTLSKRIVKH